MHGFFVIVYRPRPELPLDVPPPPELPRLLLPPELPRLMLLPLELPRLMELGELECEGALDVGLLAAGGVDRVVEPDVFLGAAVGRGVADLFVPTFP